MPNPSTKRSGSRCTASALFLALLVASCTDGPLGEQKVGAGHPDADGAGLFSWLRPTPKPLTDCAGLAKWLASNGDRFTAKIKRPGFEVEATYRAAACTACMEDREAAFADTAFQARVAQLRQTELYILKLTPGQEGDSLTLDLGAQLAGSLVEVVGTDTFPCSFIHVEALPSLLPYRTALIAFDRPQDDRDRQLVLLDPASSYGGNLTFLFPQGHLRTYLALVPDTLTSPRS